ncbi:MAG: cytochrome c oxidase assembly protein [Alsobacter sp.]|jgi:cytochrome c oxidase assembly protein subunit 11
MTTPLPPPTETATDATAARQQRAVRRTAVICTSIFAGMLGMAYAAVPLYDLFCRVTGFGGTPMVATAAPGAPGDRAFTVRFDANVSPGLNWRFEPEVASVEARVGETLTVFYKLTNTGDRPTVGIASFNVAPDTMGGYFNKLQCFCFNEIALKPGESMEAPVVFFIDPTIDQNRDLKSAAMITLSYTFFPAKGSQKPLAELKDGTTPKL